MPDRDPAPASPHRLPAGTARETLREKGQFWTPDWVADAMVGYAAAGGARTLFDPAVGAGAFFRAARRVEASLGRRLDLAGREIDPAALAQAEATGLAAGDLAGVELRDFVLEPPAGLLAAVVANPPYIRHHRLPPEVKAGLRAFGAALLGEPLDGRAGLHVYFLLRALQLLAPGGRLAFIMPADTCEGKFAPPLWAWIAGRFRLDAVITFAPGASPFPRVDTNALVFFIRNAPPALHFPWARVERPTPTLAGWALSDLQSPPAADVTVTLRELAEGIRSGLSRPPQGPAVAGPTLHDYARVMRGIVTGDNDFFFLTRTRAAALGIPAEFLLPAVGRTRDVEAEVLTDELLDGLDRKGRPTLLFSPDGRPLEAFPPTVADYLRHGEELGVSGRPLIGTRRPWYRMETRPVPPFLFAYLGRRNARFIRNAAGVLPLTSFLALYPRAADPDSLDRLWTVLRDPATVANLALVGKSYGSGAIKVEPRALERLPLPLSAVRATGLEWEPSGDGL